MIPLQRQYAHIVSSRNCFPNKNETLSEKRAKRQISRLLIEFLVLSFREGEDFFLPGMMSNDYFAASISLRWEGNLASKDRPVEVSVWRECGPFLSVCISMFFVLYLLGN